jgi:hypothetical protein
MAGQRMKRNKPKKRRDRKTGMSPYARHEKAPYKYTWRSPHARHQAADEARPRR